jgi:hypothetical protein
MNASEKLLLAALLLVSSFFSGGCALIRKGAARIVSPVASQLSEGLMRQNDVELVREGAPAFLLMLDALAESSPDNPAVLLAAAEGQLAYATGFVDRSNRKRIQTMYAKAKTYGVQALSLGNAQFAEAVDGPIDDFTKSLRRFRKKDAGALITTATAWVMWIIASSDSPAALGDMPKVLALMERVNDLDPGIRQGGVDMFYGIYYTVLPLGGGRDLERARRHFERSMEIAGPDYLLAQVTFAEYYARYAFDPELFETTLRGVLAATPATPEFTLMNSVAKMRAEELLAQMDEYF